MRKKIEIIILFILIGMFFQMNGVYANELRVCKEMGMSDNDHTLNYEIREFSFDDDTNELTIAGWAFVHNYNNYGGIKPSGYTYKQGNKSYYEADVANLQIVFLFEGKGTTYKHKVAPGDFSNFDLSKAMKYSDSSVYYIYDHIWFKTKINLDDVYSKIKNEEIKIKIYGSLDCKSSESATEPVKSKEYDLAVYSGYINNNYENLEIAGMEDQLMVSGNHIVINNVVSNGKLHYDNGYPNGAITYVGNNNWSNNSCRYSECFAYYWQNTTSNGEYYNIIERKEETVSGVSLSTFRVKWQGSNRYNFYNIEEVCGFNWYGDPASDRYRSCNEPCDSDNCTESWISVRYITIAGGVTLTYKGGPDDKYCKAINDGNINSCDGGSLNYSCDTMTVKTGSISADVSLEEHAELYGVDSSGNYIYYPYVTAYAGGFLNFGFVYKDTVSWTLKDASRYTNEQKVAIGKAMKDKYYNKIDASLLSLLGTEKSDKANEPNATMKNAGAWKCTYSGNFADSNGGNVVTTCTFNIKTAYLKDGQAIYESKDNFMNSGYNGRFYLYRNYLLNTYRWNIKSFDSVSSLKVQTDEDKVEQIIFEIDTNSNVNNYCYFRVENDVITDDDPEDPDNPTGIGKLKIVYRSIDESNPFPKISNYNYYPQNWKDYYINSGKNWDRINNSFLQDIDYKTNVLTRDLIKKLNQNTLSYTMDDVDLGGNVSSVINGDYFSIYSETKHNKKGYYLEGSDSQ